MLQTMADCCEETMHPVKLAAALGLECHPGLRDAFRQVDSFGHFTWGSANKHYCAIRDAVYHVDLQSQYFDVAGLFDSNDQDGPSAKGRLLQPEDVGARPCLKAADADPFTGLLRRYALQKLQGLLQAGSFFSLPKYVLDLNAIESLDNVLAHGHCGDGRHNSMDDDDGDLGHGGGRLQIQEGVARKFHGSVAPFASWLATSCTRNL